MGAALVVKSLRITMERADLGGKDLAQVQAVLDLAREWVPVLMHLADADERAYEKVLARQAGGDAPALSAARREATEVPVQLAETCQKLLTRMSGTRDLCMPLVRADYDTGGWLLEAGLRTGTLIAGVNARLWAEDVAGLLGARLEALG